MKRVTHELIVRNEGLPSQRVVVRSRVQKPGYHPAIIADYQYQESVTSVAACCELDTLIRFHEDALAQVIGKDWVNYED